MSSIFIYLLLLLLLLLSLSLSLSSRVPITIKDKYNRNSIDIIKAIGIAYSISSSSSKANAAVTSSSFTSPSSSSFTPSLSISSSSISPSFTSTSSITKTTKATTLSNDDNSFINGLVSGAASRTCKELLLHPLDTVRARQQVNNSTNLFDDLYSGITPALLGGIPAGAAFFAFKDYSKSKLRKLGLTRDQATLLSVAIANIPYWIIRTPSEVIKTQEQVGSKYEYIETLKQYIKDPEPIIKSYNSFSSNYIYALPTDVIKFLAYESLKSSIYNKNDNEKVEGLEAAIIGALAGLVAYISTTPLDVIRTRIMADINKNNIEDVDYNLINSAITIIKEEGYGALLSGMNPRILRALASGAIQFTSYELTQNILKKN